MVALDLLGIATGGREDEHRYAEVAPACQGDLLLHPVRVPAVRGLHVAHRTPSLLLTRRRTSAPRGAARSARRAGGLASSPNCGRLAPRRTGRPYRSPGTWSPWSGWA